MTVLLMTSAKMFCSTPIHKWKQWISKDTFLVSEKSSQLEMLLAYNNLFVGRILFDDYFESAEFEEKILQANRDFKFRKIIALSEGDLLRAARFRELLDIPGEKLNEVVPFRNKICMKSLAASYGINVANHTIVKNLEVAMDFTYKNGYPVIVKPIDGRGSALTYKLNNLFELKSYFKNNPLQQILIEQFVQGDMYHIDGLVVNGKVSVCSPAKYINSCLELVNGTALGSYTLMASNPIRKRLVIFAKYLLEKVFPTPKTALYHVEVFVDKSHKITLCEVASRLGGNNINQEVYLAYGVDIKKEYIHFNYQEKTDFIYPEEPYRCAGRYLIPPNNGQLAKVPALPDYHFIDEAKLNLNSDNLYKKMAMSNNELASFILTAETEEEILAHFEKIKQWQAEQIVWKPPTFSVS